MSEEIVNPVKRLTPQEREYYFYKYGTARHKSAFYGAEQMSKKQEIVNLLREIADNIETDRYLVKTFQTNVIILDGTHYTNSVSFVVEQVAQNEQQ